MIALLLAAHVALDPAAAAEKAYARNDCAAVERLFTAHRDLAAVAYFAGACRLAAEDASGAEDALTIALTGKEWETLARFLRGVARFRAGHATGARDDLQSALASPDLPPDLATSARELLATAGEPTLHGATCAMLDYDTNALQSPLATTADVPITPSPAAFASVVGLWDPSSLLHLQAIALQRQVFLVPEASLGALLLRAEISRESATKLSLALESGGYLFGWSPFLATAGARLGFDWTAAGGSRLSLAATGHWQQFSAAWASFTGPDAGATLEFASKFGPLTPVLGLEHATYWASDPDFQRNVESGYLELKLELGPVTTRLRAGAGAHLYANPNSLPDTSGALTARRDLRYEAVAGLDWTLSERWSLLAEASALRNDSSIPAYAFRRELLRAGVACAF